MEKHLDTDLLFYYIDLLSIINTIIDCNIDEEYVLEMLDEIDADNFIIIVIKILYKKNINNPIGKAEFLEYIHTGIKEKIDVLKELNNLKL